MRPSSLIVRLAGTHPIIALALARVLRMVTDSSSPHWLQIRLEQMAGFASLKRTMVGKSASMLIPAGGSLDLEIGARGTYEPATTRVCQVLLGPGMVALDIGANAGYFTVLFAELVGDSGTTFAFEPSRQLHDLLCKNVQLNRFVHVRTVRGAVSNVAGELDLYHGTDTTQSLAKTRFTLELSERVTVLTLDEYLPSLPRVDLVKIDVEGAELKVLEGAEETLRRYRPLIVVEASEFTSSFGYSPLHIHSFLDEREYAMYRIDDGGLTSWEGTLDESYVNVLAIPREQTEKFSLLRSHSIFDIGPEH